MKEHISRGKKALGSDWVFPFVLSKMDKEQLSKAPVKPGSVSVISN